jgi:hypothetical protein
MAEHLHHGPAELGAPMDYAEHERTFEGFLMLTKLTVAATIATMLSLVLFSFAGGAGFWLGTLVLVLMFVALGIGFAAKGSVKPLVLVNILGVLLIILTVS